MSNPVCISPLKFYDDFMKQSHRKSYAHGHISPLIMKLYRFSPFQFVIPTDLYNVEPTLYYAYLHDAKTDEIVSTNLAQQFIEAGFSISNVDEYKVALYNGILPVQGVWKREGLFYLELSSENRAWRYYSEVFCITNNIDDCLEIEYWNSTGNFYIKNGVIAFPINFHFKLLVKSEVGKPEYNFEEESTKRLGYNFIESQVSKKVYKFNTIIPEFICDAIRLIRLCDNKIIRSNNDVYEAMTFEMEADWQTQGDLASVTCEFETDNVITNLGGFVPGLKGGDFNEDHNEDFYIG